MIRPTFAEWQASRGIIPWTWLHGISAIDEALQRLLDAVLGLAQVLADAFVPAAQAAIQAFNELAAALEREE